MRDVELVAFVVLIGLAISGGSIWGIVKLSKAMRRMSPGMKLVALLAIVALSSLALAGVASAGCVALLASSNFHI
jgi:hypothetical protein